MQKIGKEWVPIEIYEDDFRPFIPVVLNKQKLVLSNKKSNNIEEITPFEVIKIYPYPFEFYRFNKNGKYYFTPKETYQDIKLASGKLIYRKYAYLDFRLLNI
jgi:hypothetical protein